MEIISVANCLREQLLYRRFVVKVVKVLQGDVRDLTIESLSNNEERRLRKRHLKSEVALLQTLSRLFHLVHFVKCWQFFVELNSKRLNRSSGKRKIKLLSCVHVLHKT